MYVVYCQNKPKSEHVVSEFGDSYFEVSGRDALGEGEQNHQHEQAFQAAKPLCLSLSPGAPAAVGAPPAAQ